MFVVDFGEFDTFDDGHGWVALCLYSFIRLMYSCIVGYRSPAAPRDTHTCAVRPSCNPRRRASHAHPGSGSPGQWREGRADRRLVAPTRSASRLASPADPRPRASLSVGASRDGGLCCSPIGTAALPRPSSTRSRWAYRPQLTQL